MSLASNRDIKHSKNKIEKLEKERYNPEMAIEFERLNPETSFDPDFYEKMEQLNYDRMVDGRKFRAPKLEGDDIEDDEN